tara:strand:- start:389 stop:772 length:384 start_codon:yes stop_codon:yes gene_type:complete
MNPINAIDVLLVAGILTILDGTFIYFMKNRFVKQIEKITCKPIVIRFSSVVACYIILTIGVYYFVIYKNSSLVDSGLMGFMIYGIFETTNLAIFKDWNIVNAVIDSIWGGLLFVLTKLVFVQLKTVL